MLETKVKIIHDDPSRFEARESYYPWPFGGPVSFFDFLLIPFRLIWLLITGSRRITINAGKREIVILHGHFGIGFCRHIHFSEIRSLFLNKSTHLHSDLNEKVMNRPPKFIVQQVPQSGTRFIEIPSYNTSSRDSGPPDSYLKSTPVSIDSIFINTTATGNVRLLSSIPDEAAMKRATDFISKATGFTVSEKKEHLY